MKNQFVLGPRSLKILPLRLTGGKIQGELEPPADKSITHRAIFFSALSPEKSVIENPLLAEDCLSTLRCFQDLGVPISLKNNRVTVAAGKKRSGSVLRLLSKPKRALDCGNSGTTMRMLSGVLAGQPFLTSLVGDASLSRRPMLRVIDPLNKMGAQIKSANGNPPLRVNGSFPLKSLHWENKVASAQVKSALLLAGLSAVGKTCVWEPVKSRDHSERLLRSMGAQITQKRDAGLAGGCAVTVRGLAGALRGLHMRIPGDFSSAAFFIAAALMSPGSKLKINNLNLNPTRTGFLNVIRRMGAKTRIVNARMKSNEPVGDLWVEYSPLKGAELKCCEVPGMIDEVPILAVLATQAKGSTKIRGAGELRVKESDRLRAISLCLSAMGARIAERKEGLDIWGPCALRGAKVRSFGDHRIAMSMSIAALLAQGKTEIVDFDCVRISYPDFLQDMKSVIRAQKI